MGARQMCPPGPLSFHLVRNVAQRLLDLLRRHALFQPVFWGCSVINKSESPRVAPISRATPARLRRRNIPKATSSASPSASTSPEPMLTCGTWEHFKRREVTNNQEGSRDLVGGLHDCQEPQRDLGLLCNYQTRFPEAAYQAAVQNFLFGGHLIGTV